MRPRILITVGVAVATSCKGTTLAVAKSPSFQLRRIALNSPQQNRDAQQRYHNSAILRDAIELRLRGGATKRKKGGRTASLSSTGRQSTSKTVTGKTKVKGSSKNEPQKSAVSDTLTKYKAILPLTRIYITLVGLVTLLGLFLGEELAQGVLALDPIRTTHGLELWRPITAACFLGPPSISWLMNAYYLFEYGSSLERGFGTAQFLVFILIQITFLAIFSAFFGQPFFAQSVITSMLHVLSRSMPKQMTKWLIFTVPYWTLPYGLMASDVLQAKGDMTVALPHVLGILTGHFFFFHRFVWPKAGGEDWLIPPDFLKRKLDGNGVARNKSKESVSNALKARKRGRGKKLG